MFLGNMLTLWMRFFSFGVIFLQYFEFKEALEAVLGRQIDLVCEGAIRNPHFRQELEATRQSLYAA